MFCSVKEAFSISNTVIPFVEQMRLDDEENGKGMLLVNHTQGRKRMCEILRERSGRIALLWPSADAVSVAEFLNSAACDDDTDAPAPAASKRTTKPTFVLLDGTWNQARALARSIKQFAADEQLDVVDVVLDVPGAADEAKVSSGFERKRVLGKLWQTPLENNGVSFSPLRTQVGAGRLTSGECLWLLLRELGASEQMLQRQLDGLRLRVCMALHWSTASFLVDRETLDWALAFVEEHDVELKRSGTLRSRLQHSADDIRAHEYIQKK